jgi:hypothetical protein
MTNEIRNFYDNLLFNNLNKYIDLKKYILGNDVLYEDCKDHEVLITYDNNTDLLVNYEKIRPSLIDKLNQLKELSKQEFEYVMDDIE